MKELLIIAVIFATTCLLLLLRSLICGKQAKCYRIHQQYFNVVQTDSNGGKPIDKWSSIVGQADESSEVEKRSADDKRIELELMQERTFRLLP